MRPANAHLRLAPVDIDMHHLICLTGGGGGNDVASTWGLVPPLAFGSMPC